MINIEEVINEKYPSLSTYPKPLVKLLMSGLKKLFKENEINKFLEKNKGSDGLDFVDKVLEHFQFSYKVGNHDKKHIPTSGRVLIVANHPIGSLDGLALLRFISEIRPDIKIISNDLLSSLAPLKPLLLPVDNLKSNTSVGRIKNLLKSLNKDEAVIVFPAGEVSRLSPWGVRDGTWKDGFARIAEQTRSPILPIHIKSRNSLLFYSASVCSNRLASLLLVNEMFNKVAGEVEFTVGKVIPPANAIARKNFHAKDIRKKVYQLPKQKQLCADISSQVALPENRQSINRELNNARLLARLRDGKAVYLFDYIENSAVMREIGRLRELTFRSIGEGVGISRDLDIYDHYYRHIVLWDAKDLEVVGAYRIGDCKNIIQHQGVAGLYTHGLFDFDESFIAYAEHAIELGRSFVQPKYWNTRSLDYLWYGVGAYLKHHPEIKYMFGPASISNSYPNIAKEKLVSFYQHFFGSKKQLVKAKRPYQLPDYCRNQFDNNYSSAFKKLKTEMKLLGCTVPVLYKQYSELCEPDGIQFLDFSIDPEFGNCIDGMILVEIAKIRKSMMMRYINTTPLVA